MRFVDGFDQRIDLAVFSVETEVDDALLTQGALSPAEYELRMLERIARLSVRRRRGVDWSRFGF